MPAPTPETIALARRLYAEGVTVARILGETGMSLGTLYYWLDGGPEGGGEPRLPALPLSFFIARPFEKIARVFTAGRK